MKGRLDEVLTGHHTRESVALAPLVFLQDRGILPNIRVDPTPKDMATGIDTILEHTLSLIR